MGTSIRRSAIWLVLAALSIAAAAWMGISASAGVNAGTPPDDTTGELKIIKNLGGQWPDGAFIFTWDCTDGQTGSATFPDDFTGANFETGEEYLIGTICTVEETDGILSVSDYNVSTHIESAAGFQAINPRDVPIDNSVGQNVIQYKNELIEVEPDDASVRLTKVGPSLGFGFAISCTDQTASGFTLNGGSYTDWTFGFDSVDDTITCTIVEEKLTGWTTTVVVTGANSWDTGVVGDYPSTSFTFGGGDSVEVTFTNVAAYLSVPPTGRPPIS